MKSYNIDRAKDLNDQWDEVKETRAKLGSETTIYLLVKASKGDSLLPISITQASAILDEKETELKKRLTVIGVDVGE